jgi:phosphonate transport system substrate-binding protein
LCQAVAQFMGERLGIRTQFVAEVGWLEREKRFDAGEIEICWMCGWPYVNRADRADPLVDLIAAPVMAHPRYKGQPVYFSDVVVSSDSPFYSFSDLRGASWAYNEPMSHSGCIAVRHFLAEQNICGEFFGTVVESGSHQASVDLILSRAVDGSAIDSTVFENALQQRPAIRPLLRIIETIGPSPAPPWVMHRTISPDLRDAVRREFLNMHQSPKGRAILEVAGLQRFEAVDDGHYDSIRQMAATAAKVVL